LVHHHKYQHHQQTHIRVSIIFMGTLELPLLRGEDG
jgi:hypothetical protein